MDKDSSFKLLDAFYEQGGNFIDTANNYQNGESESWLGEWMAARGNRDHMFIATKYTTNYKFENMGKVSHALAYGGNNKKSMQLSVRDSLKKLQTDYIDLLYVHWWDHSTSIEEMMDSLHILVQQGKVLYLGVSDTPAWVVSAANTYAKAHGKTPFSVYQGRWNIMLRDFEREIIPMVRQFGMALAPWDVLGSGRLQTKKQLEEKSKQGEGIRAFFSGSEQTENEVKMSAALEKVAGELGIESIQRVALAYILQKVPYVFPIVGGRKVHHLEDNIKALELHLSDKQVEELESVIPFDTGFPSNMIGDNPRYSSRIGLANSEATNVEVVKDGKALGHA